MKKRGFVDLKGWFEESGWVWGVGGGGTTDTSSSTVVTAVVVEMVGREGWVTGVVVVALWLGPPWLAPF